MMHASLRSDARPGAGQDPAGQRVASKLPDMSAPAFDTRHLDLLRFSAAAGTLAGEWPAAALDRLSLDAPPAGAGTVPWTARGEQRAVSGGAPELWLHLQATAAVHLVCQRCLQGFDHPLHAERSIRWVADEAEAERLDELSDDDVLALPAAGRVDLQQLVEDELILNLPLVPRHEVCPEPLAMPADDLDAPLAPSPFSALAGLKTRRG